MPPSLAASTVEVHRTVEDIPAADWDALAGDQPFAQHRWLRLAEAVLAGHRPRYVLLRDGGRLVAAAAGTLEDELQNPVLDRRFGWIVRRSPFLLVHLPMTATDGLLLTPDPSGATRARLLAALHGVLRRERHPFCIVDHLAGAAGDQPPSRGYQPLPWLPETRLDLEWSSFEEYLAALPRKKRQEIGRAQRRADHEGIVVKPLTPTAELSPVLDRMVAAVTDRHGGRRHYGPDLFPTAAAALGDDLTVLAAHRGGQVVGCVALLRGGANLVVRWIGRDYARTGATATYHALVTACVRTAVQATATGARVLHLGGAAYETKRQFGVRLETRSRLFAARSRAITALMGRLSRHFDPPALRPS